MSVNLSSGAKKTLFDNSVKNAYQSGGPNLRDCVTFRDAPGQETYNFRTIGRITAQERGATQTKGNNANITHSKVPCTMGNYYATDLTDIFDQAETNAPQEIVALGSAIGMALRRQEAQLVIDALDAASLSAAHEIGGGAGIGLDSNGAGEGINLLAEGRALLKANDIEEPVCFLYTEKQEAQLLRNAEFVSADYASYRERDTGNIRDGHFGLKYRRVGTGRSETGLTVSGTERDCYMFVPSAVGLVINLDNMSRVDYESAEFSWRSAGFLKAGAVAIDPLGIVKITVDEA